jgi:hypothetical protein
MMDLGQALRLAQEVADHKTELAARGTATEIGWLDVGDLDGARRRMLALEERFEQNQEVLLFVIWVRHLAWILCEVPDERAWDQAEALMARLLSDTSGWLFVQLAAQGTLARVALLRGQLDRAEELARAAMQRSPLAPRLKISTAPVQIRALIGLGRAAEAAAVAEQVLGVLAAFGGAGTGEVEARVAVVEAFEASGQHERARAELAETLRQVEFRADDITDPVWRESYLTRNPHSARALELGRARGLSRR